MGCQRICCGVSVSFSKLALTNGASIGWNFSCITGGRIRYSQLSGRANASTGQLIRRRCRLFYVRSAPALVLVPRQCECRARELLRVQSVRTLRVKRS